MTIHNFSQRASKRFVNWRVAMLARLKKKSAASRNQFSLCQSRMWRKRRTRMPNLQPDSFQLEIPVSRLNGSRMESSCQRVIIKFNNFDEWIQVNLIEANLVQHFRKAMLKSLNITYYYINMIQLKLGLNNFILIKKE